jgi:hypothetical protein
MSSSPVESARPAEREPALATRLERWVSEGLITSDQAARILAAEAVPRPRGEAPGEPAEAEHGLRTALVTEALGYLGGVLVLIAVGLIAARFWQELGTPVRLSVVALGTVLLLVGGLAVPRPDGAAGRLRSVLWALSAAGTAVFLSLLGSDALGWRDEDVALLAGAGTALLAAALWWAHRRPLQQLVLFVALAVTLTAATAQVDAVPDDYIGAPIWVLGVVWFLLGRRGLVAPTRVAELLGAVGALIGAMTTMGTDPGRVLALVTVVALVVVAVVLRDLVLLAVAAIGALQVLPVLVNEWFPGALAAPIVLLLLGAGLVAAAVWTARRRPPGTLDPSVPVRPPDTLPR